MNQGKSVIATIILLVITIVAMFAAGCATRQPGKLVYRQDQFKSRLEYLRFCQHYELQTYRCPD
jgi:hypothetical protein